MVGDAAAVSTLSCGDKSKCCECSGVMGSLKGLVTGDGPGDFFTPVDVVNAMGGRWFRFSMLLEFEDVLLLVRVEWLVCES